MSNHITTPTTPASAAKVTVSVPLSPMPQGTVALGRDTEDTADATVSAFGLTHGSQHEVELVNGAGGVVASFGWLTASSAGQFQGTLDSGYKFSLAPSWRVVILNGMGNDPVSTEPITQTGQYAMGTTTYQLMPVEVDASGNNYGTLQGMATLTCDPNAQTITVTLNASGLTPGAHAAHIHSAAARARVLCSTC